MVTATVTGRERCPLVLGSPLQVLVSSSPDSIVRLECISEKHDLFRMTFSFGNTRGLLCTLARLRGMGLLTAPGPGHPCFWKRMSTERVLFSLQLPAEGDRPGCIVYKAQRQPDHVLQSRCPRALPCMPAPPGAFAWELQLAWEHRGPRGTPAFAIWKGWRAHWKRSWLAVV